MTVSNTTAKAGPLVGNGVVTSFGFLFKCYDKTHIQVLRRTSGVDATLVLDSDYSVTLNVDQNTSPGGTITHPLIGSPITAAQTITILSNAPDTQTTQLTNTGGFFPASVETMSDLRTIVSHQGKEAIDRSLKFPTTDSAPNALLPTSTLRANQLLGFDANGDPSLIQSLGSVAVPISFANGGTGAAAANAAGARSNLAIPAALAAQTDTGFDTGGVSATLTLTPVPALGAYTTKVRYNVKFGVASTGADTINVSALGAKNLKQYDATGAKVAARFIVGTLADIVYDGVDFVVLNALTPVLVAPVYVPVRQTCLAMSADANGLPAPTVVGGTGIGFTTLTLSSAVIATAANGWGANGAIDVTGSGSALSWTGLSVNGTMYLYADIAGGVLTGGVGGTLAPAYQFGGAYSGTAGQFTFDIQEMNGKIANVQAARVYLGEVTVAAGVISAITWYALLGRHFSSVAFPGLNTVTTMNHNLGVIPFRAQLSAVLLAAIDGHSIGTRMPIYNTGGDTTSPRSGSNVSMSRLSARVVNDAASGMKVGLQGGSHASFTSANANLELMAERGW